MAHCVVERTNVVVKLELTEEEAQVLVDILAHIGGNGSTRRGISDRIYGVLVDNGFYYDHPTRDLEGGLTFLTQTETKKDLEW